MTHPTYTQQALSRYNLPRLKRIAAERGVTPTGDKRAADTWVNAIITHQSTQLQKVDNQATAQAELDNYIAHQAQAVAPEPFRIVEISFSDHEYYAGNQLIASISHDDDHLTQRWVAKPIRNYQFAIRSYFPVGARLPTNLQLSNWNLAYRKLRIANCELTIVLVRCDRFICTHYKDGTLPVQEQKATPPTTENQIMAHIFNECQNYNNSQFASRNSQLNAITKSEKPYTCNDSIINSLDNCELRTANCELLSDWWVILGYSGRQQYSNSVYDAVRSLSMVDTLPHAEAVDCEELLDRPFEMLTALDWELLREYAPVAESRELVAA